MMDRSNATPSLLAMIECARRTTVQTRSWERHANLGCESHMD